MPFKSQAQRKLMYSQHPDIAARWEKETPPGKLPKHVGKGRRRVRSKKDLEDHFHRLIDEATT